MGRRMTQLITLTCKPEEAEKYITMIDAAIDNGAWVQLKPIDRVASLIHKNSLPKGPGVLIFSGGSTNKSQQCLLPYSHLNKSAIATGQWLKDQGLEPRECNIFNALPIHHVSGLMPWWRSRCWSSRHIFIKPALIHNPKELNRVSSDFMKGNQGPRITSLVPTQLKRLLEDQAGKSWLRSFAVIWIGGSPIPEALLTKARDLGIRLSPSYGSTETTAMITAQSPEDFLAGEINSGTPLKDIELRLGSNNRLQVRTTRLAIASWQSGKLKPLIVNDDGWWDSADIAELNSHQGIVHLKIIGRVDTAIISGGETVYPEYLQSQLLKLARQEDIPIQEVLFIPIQSKDWGQRLVALIRFKHAMNRNQSLEAKSQLETLVKKWVPAERPVAWYQCPELQMNECGKWEFAKWQTWLKGRETGI